MTGYKSPENALSTDDGSDDNTDSVDDVPVASNYRTKVHYRQTRKRGKIVKQVTEQYIRSDLGFGVTYTAEGDAQENSDSDDDDDDGNHQSNKLHSAVDQVVGRPCVIPTVQDLLERLIPNCKPYALVVVDANVLLHNFDVLEKAVLGGNGRTTSDSNDAGVMPNIVIPQTALMECRSNRLTAYDRTVDLLRSVTRELPTETSNLSKQQTKIQRHCPILFPDQNHNATAIQPKKRQINVSSVTATTPNDENDERIRRVAHFLAEETKGTNLRVVLLSDDKASRQKAHEESGNLYQAHSVASWVKLLEQANPQMTSSLSDLVANFSTDKSQSSAGLTAINEGEQGPQYTPHLESSDLSMGIQQGKYHRGTFRVASQASGGKSRTGSVTVRQGQERVAVTISTQQDCNRAVDGDIVAISINPVEEWISAASSLPKSSGPKEQAEIAPETAEATPADLENVAESIAMNTERDISMMRPTGKVVGIMRRNFAAYSGSIYETANKEKRTGGAGTKKSSSDYKTSSDLQEREAIASQYEREHADGTFTCVFFPVGQKVPPVLIRTTQRSRLMGQRIVVAMDSWPTHSIFPLGHYVRTIGPAGSKDVETQVLLQEHNIPHEPFPAAVLACLPPDDYKIGADMTDKSPRLDLRHLPILSIDPPGCKDIDDCLHSLKLPNGNIQIGVHIADVTHYVKAGTAIDQEAANRSTSTYLVNRRLDMLPGLLTTDLCSLKGNVDRYAFSVLWEVTEAADIVDVKFHKTLIHSIGALTYQQAQSLIDQPEDPNDVQACAVKGLAMLARKFRQRRIDAGALTLASPEVKFVLDSESLNPTDVQAYALLEANAVVEEFMLLANVTVSKKILRHYPTLSVLRRHPNPNRSMFDSLISKAKSKGLKIEIENSKCLADSLDAAQVEEDPYVNKLLRILSTRCMSPAQYFCSGEFAPTEWHHYGLAAPVYTHFTSPIRRYADVCVHRLLAAAINVAPLPPHLSSKSYLHDLCANMNRRHRAAQMAGRASVQLHTLIFFSGEWAKEEHAYILDIDTAETNSPSFSVMVPRYGIEGKVRLSIDASDPNLTRIPHEHKLAYNGESGETTSLQVFDKVKVRIWVRETEDHRRELILDLLEPRLGKESTGDREPPAKKARTN